jgi:hypothetical protein
VGCLSSKLYRLFQTQHSFSVTIFTLGFRLFFYSAANKLVLKKCTAGQNDDFVPYSCCVIYCHSKVFTVQATRLYSLICSLVDTWSVPLYVRVCAFVCVCVCVCTCFFFFWRGGRPYDHLHLVMCVIKC